MGNPTEKTPEHKKQQMLDRLQKLVEMACQSGADAADAVQVEGVSQSVACRLGQIEHAERSEGADMGLRVLIGRRQAIVSTGDLSESGMAQLVEKTIAMAKVVPEDPYAGLADPAQLAQTLPTLESYDPTVPSTEQLTARAQMAEDAARAVKGVTNSEGADASYSTSDVAVVASNGFARYWNGSSFSISACVLAADADGNMERDYDYTAKVFDEDLASPEEVGANAGARAVARLGAQKLPTMAVPVIYDARVARSMLSHFAGAINGSSIARGTSFLRDALHSQVFAAGVQIIDDPHMQRGARSKPCDAEGLANGKRTFVENGTLKSWVLDLRTARQLGLESTGHASRGTSSAPSPAVTNFYMAAGEKSVADMIKGMEKGVWVTELFGQGVNGVTGDYSRGASGFYIENGEIQYPVSEFTLAGNLKDIFKNITPANDLSFKYGLDSPSLWIEGLTLAGK
jgi:PmbA protein